MEISRAMTKLQETCRALRRRLERIVGLLPEHPEATCGTCGGDNVCWFAPSSIWNSVARRDGTDPMLCPRCFIKLAESHGYNKAAWRVEPEGYVQPNAAVKPRRHGD